MCRKIRCDEKSKKTNFEALFNFQKVLQNILDSPSHQILRHLHGALNIDKRSN